MFGGFGRRPGQFTAPVDIERDAQGNLYVIDSTSKRLQKFDANGNFLATVDIRVSPGDTNEGSQPWGLGIAPDGTVVVADTFGWRIRTFTPDLVPTGVTFGKAPNPDPAVKPGEFDLYGPRDVAFDRQGNMWVTDGGHDRIVVYTLKGEFVRAIGGTGSGPGAVPTSPWESPPRRTAASTSPTCSTGASSSSVRTAPTSRSSGSKAGPGAAWMTSRTCASSATDASR